ncbi:LytR cell envelope-related transcriptional attenuator [Motilibacter peucedani]|uniref:LytR cell envelope-related transcriptional attenuator n=1 Tax=Motilibacter peucedani TaxID=598650 RepID=A0A420XK81_9ACTN|nr:LytR C-terminal domain-containing protein [Motilibacter peucedani]RKS68489.1 LytR cell envelope-related transcriptional attenuator [Motilibacter peucedani]
MAGRRDDGGGGSPLEGLGAPRRGSHRTGGGLGGLLTSLGAVLAVVVLLGGLYVAFGRDSGDDDGGATATGGSSSAPVATEAASASATPAPTPSATPSATPTPSETPSSEASPSGTPAAESGTAGDGGAEDPGAGDEEGLHDLPVVVLNQSGQAGLAGRTASALRATGWTVSSVGNFHGSVPSTTVYYPDGALAAAQALAAELPGPDRVRPVFSGISATKLTVILA